MSNLRLLDPTFGDNLEATFRRFFPASLFPSETPQLHMRIDVTEKADAYVVKADIPGVKKEDINVRVDGSMVEIDAEVRSEKETRGDGEKLLRKERHFGSVSRAFSLGHDIDASKVEAKYTDGVLSLHLPKKTAAASSRITVG